MSDLEENSGVDDRMDILSLTTEIVASYVASDTRVEASELPGIIRSVRAALRETDASVGAEAEPEHRKATPAQVKKSITPDGLTSFVDNKVYKTLKRHLTRHGLTFEEYRRRYGLPSDYPSVAPNYSVARSEMAKKLGLGARGRGGAAAPS